MKKNNLIILGAVSALLLAILMSADDKLSELAPVFGTTAVLLTGWLIINRTLVPDKTGVVSLLTKISAFTAIAGLFMITAGCFEFIQDDFSYLLLFFGGLLLIVALILRIINGIRTKQVDATTGSLSITAIAMLLGVIGFITIAGFVFFSIMEGLGLL